MPFTKPPLFTSIDPVNYQSEINLNFTNIDGAFTSIQNELLKIAASGSPLGPSNLDWVPSQAKLNGPIGYDSFVPVFTQTTDGWDLTLEHQTPSSQSTCVIDQLVHRTSTELTWHIEQLIPSSGDGPFRMVIGLNSAGSPGLEQVVEHNESPTDDPTLLLFTFDVIRTTDGPLCINLRRETQWLMNQVAWNAIRDQDIVLRGRTFRGDVARWTPDSDGYAPTDGLIMVPFDSEVVGVSFWTEFAPVTAGATFGVELHRNGYSIGSANSERVHQGTYIVGGTDSDPVQVVVDKPVNSPTTIVKEDDIVNLVLVNPFTLIDGLDLRINVTFNVHLRRIQHDPRLNE